MQVTGSNSGTWGTDLNNNLITPLDAILGGTQSIVMSGSNVTLSLSQWQNKAFKITGTLTANVSLILPLSVNSIGGTPAVGGEFIVDNETTGSFSLTVLTAVSGSTGVTVPQGARATLYSDTVNVWYANDAFGIPAGVISDFAGTTAPPGWLLCFGQTVATAQYPALFNRLSYTYGGSGANFGIPDYRGRIGAGKDNMGGAPANRIGSVLTDSGTIVGTTLGSAGGSSTHVQAGVELAVHNHADGGHTHPQEGNTVLNNGGPTGSILAGGTGAIETGGTTGTGFANIQNAGSSQAMAWLQPTIMMNKIIFGGA